MSEAKNISEDNNGINDAENGLRKKPVRRRKDRPVMQQVWAIWGVS